LTSKTLPCDWGRFTLKSCWWDGWVAR